MPAISDITKRDIQTLDEQIDRISSITTIFMGRIRAYDNGLSATAYEAHLVEAISNHPDANTNELARLLGYTKGNISLRTNKLCQKGLIYKYNKSNNRKEIYYHLTEKGKQLYQAHQDFHEEQQRAIYREFVSYGSGERGLILHFLEGYASYMEQYYLRN